MFYAGNAYLPNKMQAGVCTFRDYVASYRTVVGDVDGLFKYESVVVVLWWSFHSAHI